LQTPHHCSWHSLSYDSWSELREDAEVSQDARSALSQIRDKGKIVASSAPIKDDDCDPPCWGAKREYEDIKTSSMERRGRSIAQASIRRPMRSPPWSSPSAIPGSM
jgi:hypothetical protein